MLNRIKKYYYNLIHPIIGEVWELHRVTNSISEDVNLREFEITPLRLESLIRTYLQKGYQFISVKRLQELIQSGAYTKRFVVITLDDGYEDNYENAYPIFKQYNVPFCVFVTKNYVQNGAASYRFMTENQIIQLASDKLCTIGSHTLSHPHLNLLSELEQQNEIVGCKQWLEKLLNHPITYMAYPHGNYNAKTLEIVKSSGIAMAFAAWGGPIRRKQVVDVLCVPRDIILEDVVKY